MSHGSVIETAARLEVAAKREIAPVLTLPVRCFCNKESRCLSSFLSLPSALFLFLLTTCAQVFDSEQEFSFTASRACTRDTFLLSGCFTLLRESFFPPLFEAEPDNPDGSGISFLQGIKLLGGPFLLSSSFRTATSLDKSTISYLIERWSLPFVYPVCLVPRRVPRLVPSAGRVMLGDLADRLLPEELSLLFRPSAGLPSFFASLSTSFLSISSSSAFLARSSRIFR